MEARKKKKKRKKKDKKGRASVEKSKQQSVVERRLQEAQDLVDKQQKEEREREFKAWTHTFDDEGLLYFENPILGETSYECPEGYETGPLPTPAEHIFEDVFKKLDRRNDGFLKRMQLMSSMKTENGLAKTEHRKRQSDKIMRLFNRASKSKEDELSLDDWQKMAKRLPPLSPEQINDFIGQFKLKDKAYYHA